MSRVVRQPSNPHETAMNLASSKEQPVPRREKIGTKLIVAYFPFTILCVLIVVLVISIRTNRIGGLLTGSAGVGALAVWITQVAITNLLIVALRFDHWLLLKATLISLASTILLPLLMLREYPLSDLFVSRSDISAYAQKIGKPDVASYVRHTSESRCELVGQEHARMFQYGSGEKLFGYDVEALIQCESETRTRACNWRFWYDDITKQWGSPGSRFLLSCPSR